MLVQLSDPHIVAPGRLLMDRIDTPALLAQAVASVCGLAPAASAVVVTGDLVDRGSADEYAHLQLLLAPLSCPVWLMPGNHDAAGALRRAFPDHAELAPLPDPALAPFVLWVREVAGLRLVALDTVVEGASHGALCEHRLAWLDRTLAEAPHQPTVVAMHHPPFATGIAHMDRIGLRQGSAALAELLRRHPQVERVLCGHLHRPIVRRFGGTVAMTVPSTAHQIVLDLREDAPATYRREPPGYALHLLRDGALVSHTVAVGDHGPVEIYD
ncbi:phosphodiesterase [Hydrogenophaga sp.]|uniref:phosphodiesterase n=1 Tax=Hydrogenophaga sp. TaxID=1904254 RepID=UPI0026029B4F|nr:phosphodiesterase [Hydrogenophaga sp.]